MGSAGGTRKVLRRPSSAQRDFGAARDSCASPHVEVVNIIVPPQTRLAIATATRFHCDLKPRRSVHRGGA